MSPSPICLYFVTHFPTQPPFSLLLITHLLTLSTIVLLSPNQSTQSLKSVSIFRYTQSPISLLSQPISLLSHPFSYSSEPHPSTQSHTLSHPSPYAVLIQYPTLFITSNPFYYLSTHFPLLISHHPSTQSLISLSAIFQ